MSSTYFLVLNNLYISLVSSGIIFPLASNSFLNYSNSSVSFAAYSNYYFFSSSLPAFNYSYNSGEQKSNKSNNFGNATFLNIFALTPSLPWTPYFQ